MIRVFSASLRIRRGIGIWAIISACCWLIVLDHAVADEKLADLPWHMATIRYKVQIEKDLHSLGIDCVVMTEIPDGVNLFVVPINTRFNGKLFYAGAITSFVASHGREKARRDYARGYVFSKWDDLSMSSIRPSAGGLHLVSDHEGAHVSVRSQYPWKKGMYTFEVVEMEHESEHGAEYVWAGAFVRSHERNETCFVGSIRFLGKRLEFGGTLSTFIELFDRDPAARPKIPSCRIAFGNLRINGKAVEPEAAGAFYDTGVPAKARVRLLSKDDADSSGLKDAFSRMRHVFLAELSDVGLDKRPAIEVLIPFKD